MEGSWVPMPRRIVVRGGVDGSFVYDGRPTNGRRESAFFGEGMTSVSFGVGRAARPRPAFDAHPPRPRAGSERREEGGHAGLRRRGRRLAGVERREGRARGGGYRCVRSCTPTQLPSVALSGAGIAEAEAGLHATRTRLGLSVDDYCARLTGGIAGTAAGSRFRRSVPMAPKRWYVTGPT